MHSGFEFKGWCAEQTTKGEETSVPDIEKFLPISLELNNLIQEIKTKKDEIQKNYANDPEGLRKALSKLGEEFIQKQEKIFKERGVSREEYIKWG